MLAQLSAEALKRGLELHPDKTKIMSNATKQTGRGKDKQATIGNMHIEILPLHGTLKYLGRIISFENTHDVEVRNRIKTAWCKFHIFKNELTSKRYSLKSRLKLFKGTVTPTMLYGCSCWTLSKGLETQIRSCQRKMLRSILGSGRRRRTDGDINHGQNGSRELRMKPRRRRRKSTSRTG